jgi:hypothetical protein
MILNKNIILPSHSGLLISFPYFTLFIGYFTNVWLTTLTHGYFASMLQGYSVCHCGCFDILVFKVSEEKVMFSDVLQTRSSTLLLCRRVPPRGQGCCQASSSQSSIQL